MSNRAFLAFSALTTIQSADLTFYKALNVAVDAFALRAKDIPDLALLALIRGSHAAHARGVSTVDTNSSFKGLSRATFSHVLGCEPDD